MSESKEVFAEAEATVIFPSLEEVIGVEAARSFAEGDWALQKNRPGGFGEVVDGAMYDTIYFPPTPHNLAQMIRIARQHGFGFGKNTPQKNIRDQMLIGEHEITSLCSFNAHGKLDFKGDPMPLELLPFYLNAKGPATPEGVKASLKTSGFEGYEDVKKLLAAESQMVEATLASGQHVGRVRRLIVKYELEVAEDVYVPLDIRVDEISRMRQDGTTEVGYLISGESEVNPGAVPEYLTQAMGKIHARLGVLGGISTTLRFGPLSLGENAYTNEVAPDGRFVTSLVRSLTEDSPDMSEIDAMRIIVAAGDQAKEVFASYDRLGSEHFHTSVVQPKEHYKEKMATLKRVERRF